MANIVVTSTANTIAVDFGAYASTYQTNSTNSINIWD